MASTVTAYADAQNARYKNSASNLVDLVQRLNNAIAALPNGAKLNWAADLKKALKQFRRNHPGVRDFNRSQFDLCQAIDQSLSQIVIDTTMQREPDLKWILKIIANFRAYQAQPIQVYVTACGRFSAWDSQHTALALYLISDYLGMPFDEVMVPCNIFVNKSRGLLRQVYISQNTTVGSTTGGENAGKKSLDLIDIAEQQIYGVECDSLTDPEWVATHEKWKHLRAAGLFLTHDKFNNTEETGAIGRLNELLDASVEVVRQFAVYGAHVIDCQATATVKRPINAKEIPIIIEFLKLCELDKVHLTDDDIRDLAQHCIDLFDANFDAKGPFWEYVGAALKASWIRTMKANKVPPTSWGPAPKNSKNTPQGVSFFWHQLDATWAPQRGVKMPKRPNYLYTPAKRDLIS
jgi:hypothetical protein